MILEEQFEQFTVYKSDVSNSFLYVNFSDPGLFMDGLSDYVLSEGNLLNYANTMSPTASPQHWRITKSFIQHWKHF